MKTRPILPLLFVLVLSLVLCPTVGVQAQEATGTPTSTITPTPTRTNTAVIPVYNRPIVVISSYGAGDNPIEPGHEFNLQVIFHNSGGEDATNLIVVFQSTDFFPK